MVSKLEVAWTLATVGLIAGVAAYSTILLYNIDNPSAKVTEYVDVIGHQWYWEFHYGSNNTWWNTTYNPTTGKVSGGALWAAPGAEVHINVTTTDVVHSFNIPGLGVRIDAIPGRVNTFAFAVPNVAPGTSYIIYCTEFCGTYHGIMRAFLDVT